MNKKILLINDLAGYGKVALSAMIPVLSHLKYELFSLPTAVVSNTLDYGKFEILDTTEYMEKTIEVWKDLGFHFDAFSTGFIINEKQVELITSLTKEAKKQNTLILSDPIMGDNGHLYNGVNESTVKLMKQLIKNADYIVPNYTEACYLTNIPYRKEGLSIEESKLIIDKLRENGSKNIIITSVIFCHENHRSVIGYDAQNETYFKLDYEEIPVSFPGTGDIFSAVLLGEIIKNNDLQKATLKAMNVVKKMISLNIDNADKYKGIPVENYLEVIDE